MSFETFEYIYSRDSSEHNLRTIKTNNIKPDKNDKLIKQSDNKDAKTIKCLEDKYKTREAYGNKFLVRDALNNNYKLFKDYSSCLDYVIDYYEKNNSVSFNEVIFGWMPQKLKFDIDVPSEDLKSIIPIEKTGNNIINTPEVIEFTNKLLLDIITCIRETFIGLYNEVLDPEDIILCGGSDNSKISFHIILKRAVLSCDDSAYFTSAVCMKSKFAKYIDTRVNLSTQTFRVIYCSKPKSSRIKVFYKHPLTCQDITAEDTIITNCSDIKIMPAIAEAPKRKITPETEPEYNVAEHETRMILDISKDWIDGYVYSGIEGNKIHLRRYKSSFCKLCGRVHDSQNAFLYVCYNSACNIYYKCYQSKERRSYVGSFPNPKCELPEHKVNKLTRVLTTGINPAISADTQVLNSLTTTRYSEPVMRDFELCRTLYVKAKMKMGKTKNLRKLIDDNFTSEIKNYKIIFISFRQTFSSNILEKFPEMTLYSNTTGILNQRKLIVQMESLHRLNVADTEPFDLVVLDESESIIEQFDSGLYGKYFDCIAKFKWLLRTCEHLICMDANIGERTFNIIERFRPSGGHFHVNEYKNATEDKYFITTDTTKYTYELIDVLTRGYRCGIPVSSLKEGKILYDIIKNKFPLLCIKMYSAETSESEKREHFSDVNNYWSKLDVLIYTPTVSAGVSFERAHFDYVFGYFTDKSCSVETTIQMLGRIRNVGMKEYYICIDATGNNLPTTTESILEDLKKNRAALYKNYSLDYINYDYTDEGKIKFEMNDNMFIWLENRKMRNLSLNYFIERFIAITQNTGATCSELICDYTDDNVDISAALNNVSKLRDSARKAIISVAASEIASASDIRDDEYIDIRAKISANLEILPKEKSEMYKKQLKKHYNWEKPVTVEFAETYMDKSVKKKFKMLSAVFSGPKLEDSLKIIQERELHYSNELLTQKETVIPKFSFNKHRIAACILKIIGFSHYNDRRMIPEYQVKENIVKNNSEIKILNELQRELEQKVEYSLIDYNYITKMYSIDEYASNVIKIYNMCIGVLYGIKIEFVKTEELYRLSGQAFKLFSFDNNNDLTPKLIKFS